MRERNPANRPLSSKAARKPERGRGLGHSADRRGRGRRLAASIPTLVLILIGVFLLLGIVMKNAILIIDFALEAEREEWASVGLGFESFEAF